jgi:predicted helicase
MTVFSNDDETGTIYVYLNEWFQQNNVEKHGISTDEVRRKATYKTGEIRSGNYVLVIKIPINKLKLLDNLLKNELQKHNVRFDGGTEFYTPNAKDLIEPYLQTLNIKYYILSQNEIDDMERKDKFHNLMEKHNLKSAFNKINIEEFIQKLKVNKLKIIKEKINNQIIQEEIKLNHIIETNKNKIIPSAQQQHILDIINNEYEQNDILRINWACGLGKSLLAILLTQKMNFKTILIGVYSINLQQQFKEEIMRIYPNKNNIMLIGGNGTNNINLIEQFINNTINNNNNNNNDNNQCKFIISTYHSCHLLTNKKIKFDFKIGDEAHHLVGIDRQTQDNTQENKANFIQFHNIKSTKTFFMTATDRFIDTYTNKILYTMDDEKFFGKCIDNKSVCWSIENKKITDYKLLVLKNTNDEVQNIIDNLKITVENKDLFISCYMSLKSLNSFNDLTHILLYTNKTDEAELAKQYIDKIIEANIFEKLNSNNLYNKALHSKTTSHKTTSEHVENFKNAQYGIISCVYLFSEGFNLPELNGVCIAGNMTSEIRICQAVLRPNRLCKTQPNKIAYVIIPYIDNGNWNNENKSYNKVRNIIAQMRNVDKSIEQRINLLTNHEMNNDNDNNDKKKDDEKTTEEGFVNINTTEIELNINFEENKDELNKLKMRMRYSKNLMSDFTEEEDEYNYIMSINKNLKIKSKRDYVQSQSIHDCFIYDPENYFKLKGVWKGWYDFMSVDTSSFIKTKEEWKTFCENKNIQSLEEYEIACEECEELPHEPEDFYFEFVGILKELKINFNRRRRN